MAADIIIGHSVRSAAFDIFMSKKWRRLRSAMGTTGIMLHQPGMGEAKKMVSKIPLHQKLLILHHFCPNYIFEILPRANPLGRAKSNFGF